MSNPGALIVGVLSAAAGAVAGVGAVRGVRTGVAPLFTKGGMYAGEARGWWGRVMAAFYLLCGVGLLAVGLGILAGRLAL